MGWMSLACFLAARTAVKCGASRLGSNSIREGGGVRGATAPLPTLTVNCTPLLVVWGGTVEWRRGSM